MLAVCYQIVGLATASSPFHPGSSAVLAVSDPDERIEETRLDISEHAWSYPDFVLLVG